MTDADQVRDQIRNDAVEAALGKLDLDTKARLLAYQDMWSLPAVPAIGLQSLVMSDGPIGVRGVRWTADDPSIALPSPTALAAAWDPELARRGRGSSPRRPAARASTSSSRPPSTCTAPRSAAGTSSATPRTPFSPAPSAAAT